MSGAARVARSFSRRLESTRDALGGAWAGAAAGVSRAAVIGNRPAGAEPVAEMSANNAAPRAPRTCWPLNMRAIVNRGRRPRFATAVLQGVENDGPVEVSGPLPDVRI